MIHRFRVTAYSFWGMIRDDWAECPLEDLEQTVRRLFRSRISRVTVWDSSADDLHELLDVKETPQLLAAVTRETTGRS